MSGNLPIGQCSVYRVQAGDGRGPWRPGFSRHWADVNRTKFQDDIVTAFGSGWLDKVPQGWHAGCACRTLEGLMEWFTPVEQKRLEAFGFAPVAIRPDLIIEENDDQVIFARRKRLTQSIIILPWRQAA